jgi:hypothetical protein
VAQGEGPEFKPQYCKKKNKVGSRLQRREKVLWEGTAGTKARAGKPELGVKGLCVWLKWQCSCLASMKL